MTSYPFCTHKELDNVIVKSVYGDKSEEEKIFLQKDESANRVLITFEQFSKELDQLKVSCVWLELVPRGVGRIQVRATNFCQELKPGERVLMNLTAYNDGTRRLDNIKVRADVSLNWLSAVAPDLISSLLPGKEEMIAVTITPPTEVSVGDYEATIKTEAFASNRKVESEDKKIRIHIATSANIFGTAMLILLLVGVLVGVVVFGVKLSRR